MKPRTRPKLPDAGSISTGVFCAQNSACRRHERTRAWLFLAKPFLIHLQQQLLRDKEERLRDKEEQQQRKEELQQLRQLHEESKRLEEVRRRADASMLIQYVARGFVARVTVIKTLQRITRGFFARSHLRLARELEARKLIQRCTHRHM